jgi:PrtD family type I secretion system ABC transporter
MQNIIKSCFKYFVFVGFFGLCVNLIYLAVPVYTMIVYDRVLFSFSKATLYTLSGGVLISLIMMGLIDYFRMRMLGQAGNNFTQKMMPFVVESMQADAAGIIRQGYARGLYDLEFLRDAIVRGHIFYILDLPWVLIYLGVLYFMHPLIGTVAIAGVFMVTLFQVLLRKLEKKRYIVADVAFQANADFIGTCLQNAQIVSGMGMLPAVMGKYRDKYKKVLAARSEAEAFQSGAGALIRLLHVMALVVVFGAGAFVFFTDEITVGIIFASVMIIARLFYPFERSLSDMKGSIEAMAAYKRLKHFVDTREKETKLSLPVPEGKFDVEAITLALNGRTIVHNISFALEPGETLGVFGPSSAGKTSLCRVLLGIWPALAGKVRLDGAQIAQWPGDELGKYVGYMPQEPELFQASVARNISRLMEADSEKVVKAAQKAGIHEMILKLPQGYDTKIDATGKNLAAGQRQLISLARALYGDPKFVVMDEPHTHLDDLGLKMLFHALNNLRQEKITTIVVTDRPALLANMNKLLLIKEGQVAMYGPGKEVLNQLANRQQPQQAAGA